MNNTFNSLGVPRLWVEQILEREHDDVRFEAFANEVVSILEGTTIVSTSRSWDLGRDGRGLANRHGTFVLTSLRSDSSKPKQDAQRVKDTAAKFRHVYYVALRITSEAVLEDHCSELRSILGTGVVIDPLGGSQIVDLVSNGKALEAFRKHYKGEVEAIKTALSDTSGTPESTHLELALSTFGAENTNQLRSALTSRLILGTLETEELSLSELSETCAKALGVASFSELTIQHHCGQLGSSGRVQMKDGKYAITDAGKLALASSNAGIVASALSGREAVRKAVEESLGSAIADSHWALIWNALQKELAHAFYMRGKQLLDALSMILDANDAQIQRDVLAGLVDNVIKKVIETYVSLPHRESMLRAFQDAFLPGDQYGAFEWLAGVAGRFVASCTLGLSPEVASTLRSTLKRIRFFLDTDVVISYLCAHEPSHEAAHAVVEVQRRLNNSVMITAAVAEETARHAMKAYTDYRVRVATVSGTLAWYEISDLESAFTREFEFLRAEGKVRPNHWPRFIRRYAGEERRAYGKGPTPNTTLMRSLLSSKSFEIHTPGDAAGHWEAQRDKLAKEMFDQAMLLNPNGRTDITEHKARIDAEMLIAVSRTMADSQARGTGEKYILITSARRLRNLPSDVKSQLPEVPQILSLAEAATIASLLPEQPLSLRALHSLLFEGHFAKTIGKLEGLLLRIVRESASAVLPGATRGVLSEEFRSAILRECNRTGEAESELRTRIEKNPVELARIASVAVDALALTRPLDKEDVLRRLQNALSDKKPSRDSS